MRISESDADENQMTLSAAHKAHFLPLTSIIYNESICTEILLTNLVVGDGRCDWKQRKNDLFCD